MHMRSGACPALGGRESTARSCGWGRQWSRCRERSRSDRQGTARTGETWERRRRDGEVWRMCNKHFFFMTLEPCVYVTRMKMCEVRSERAVRRKMSVRQVSVCTRSHNKSIDLHVMSSSSINFKPTISGVLLQVIVPDMVLCVFSS